MRGGIGIRWFWLLALGLSLLSGCGGSSSSDTTTGSSQAASTRFDAQRAYELVRQQVEVGQRPAGSPQLRKLANELVKMLPEGKFESIPGEPGLRNIVGSLPGEKPAVVIGAHYDTLVKPKGFVGANNGAAGTAVVIEVSRYRRGVLPSRAEGLPRIRQRSPG
jgi:hypothetical protein